MKQTNRAVRLKFYENKSKIREGRALSRQTKYGLNHGVTGNQMNHNQEKLSSVKSTFHCSPLWQEMTRKGAQYWLFDLGFRGFTKTSRVSQR